MKGRPHPSGWLTHFDDLDFDLPRPSTMFACGNSGGDGLEVHLGQDHGLTAFRANVHTLKQSLFRNGHSCTIPFIFLYLGGRHSRWMLVPGFRQARHESPYNGARHRRIIVCPRHQIRPDQERGLRQRTDRDAVATDA